MEVIKLGKTKEQLETERDKWKEEYKQNVLSEIKNPVKCNECHSLLKISEEDLIKEGYVYRFKCVNCSNLQLLYGEETVVQSRKE